MLKDHFSTVAVYLISAFLISLAFFSLAAAEDRCTDTGQYLVRINEEALRLNAQERQNPALRMERENTLMRSFGFERVVHRFQIVSGLLQVEGENVSETARRQMLRSGSIRYLEQNCPIRRIEPVYKGTPLSSEEATALSRRQTPNDTRFALLWAHQNDGSLGGTPDMDMDSTDAWDLTTGSESVVVGIVDSGIDYTHADLMDNLWVNPGETAGNGIDDDGNGYVDDVYGINALLMTGDPQDDSLGHGTHVSGIVGAVGNNALGVVGVNWTVKLMGLKIIHGSSGTDADAIRALEYAAMMKNAGVNIVALNNSWGSTGTPPQALVDAVSEVNDAGILFVAASGNDAFNNDVIPDTPSGIEVENVISVASVSKSGSLSSFSNYGPTTVDLAAPGESILSTLPNNLYASWSGTSMAAPQVTGVAALVAAYEPSLSASSLKSRLLNTVKSVPSLNGTMVSPGIVNASGALTGGFDCDTGSTPSLPSGDSDGDGVADSQENTDGTDPADPGSFRVHLQSPVFALWTGFLEITNILELVNTGSSALEATVALFSINGASCNQVSVTIPAQQQYDLILNDFSTYTSDSYGLVRITYSGSTLDGRVSYYRSSAAGNSYDFAYSIPLANPSYGDTAVSYNTYQPSLDPSEETNLVANWLSIVNLSDSSKNFDISQHAMDGSNLSSDSYLISSKTRLDIDGGHVNPGPSNVGFHKISPGDSTAPYLALVTRYGYNVPPGQDPTNYEFAFPLIAKAGNGQASVAPLTTTQNAQSWLEVVNTSSSAVSVAIDFYRNDGALMAEEDLSLAANSQVHFNANSRLGDEQTGFAQITPSASNSIVAQSMVYLRDSASGAINAMYGSQARQSAATALYGSYNLFLDMYNWLKLINPSSLDISAALTLGLPDGSTSQHNVTVPAQGSIDLGLHDTSTYSTTANSYGTIEVAPDNNSLLFSELLRLRIDPSTQSIDFAAPTEVR